jgi:hypothetical protein
VNGVGDAFAEVGNQVAASFLPERVGNASLEVEDRQRPDRREDKLRERLAGRGCHICDNGRGVRFPEGRFPAGHECLSRAVLDVDMRGVVLGADCHPRAAFPRDRLGRSEGRASSRPSTAAAAAADAPIRLVLLIAWCPGIFLPFVVLAGFRGYAAACRGIGVPSALAQLYFGRRDGRGAARSWLLAGEFLLAGLRTELKGDDERGETGETGSDEERQPVTGDE